MVLDKYRANRKIVLVYVLCMQHLLNANSEFAIINGQVSQHLLKNVRLMKHVYKEYRI